MSINLVVLSGFVIKQPETKTTASGAEFTKFCISTKSTKKDQNGDYVSYLFNCIAWGPNSTYVSKFVNKRTRLTITGRLEENQYIDRGGKKRTSIDINVSDIDIIRTNKDVGDNKNTEGNTTTETDTDDRPFEPIPDEELPF